MDKTPDRIIDVTGTTNGHGISRAQLAQAFNLGVMPVDLLLAEPSPMVAIDPDWATVQVADILDWPVRDTRITEQCGRFALVEYEPFMRSDPDLIICFQISPEATAFHTAMAAFQKARAFQRQDPGAWMRQARVAMQHLESALYRLHPALDEADFVVRWARLVVAKFRNIEKWLIETPKPPDPTPDRSLVRLVWEDLLDFIEFYLEG